MSRATEDTLGALHGLIADTYAEQIKALVAAGEPVPPALLTSAAKFLKDNGVDAPASTSKKLDRLAQTLPSMDDLDNVVGFPRK